MKPSHPARSLAAAATFLVAVAGCSLPPRGDPPVSAALSPAEAEATWLGRVTQPGRSAHPGLSAVLPLPSGREAFGARIALMRAAERTLDLQYYIWHPDLTGHMMLAEALAAADRGVRVRLLVDDNGIGGLDPLLAAVDTHPRIEVRIFNPFPTRRAKWIGFITDFSRVNRRMHNKSLTADGMVSIIGGRNIGDEYFDAQGPVTFADLDVVVAGSAASEIDSDFDRYWNSEAVWPAGLVLRPPPAGALDRLRAAAVDAATRPEVTAYRQAVRETLTIAEIGPRIERRDWVRTRLVSDDPAKATGRADRTSLLLARLGEVTERPSGQFDLISAYFVPTAVGTGMLTGLAKSGVTVRVLTNSLQANDVAVVHAGYAKWRRALLQAGVQLHELRPLEARGRGSAAAERSGSASGGLAGSSSASLHAKTFAIDGRQVFVGSFNFDPRSAELNTELGLLIDSELLAAEMRRVFNEDLDRAAWTVTLDDGKLVWTGRDDAGAIDVRHSEPDTSLWQRGMLRVLSWLPIDWLL